MSGFCARREMAVRVEICFAATYPAPANSRCPTCPAPENRFVQGKKVSPKLILCVSLYDDALKAQTKHQTLASPLPSLLRCGRRPLCS